MLTFCSGQTHAQPQPGDNGAADMRASPHMQYSEFLPQLEQWEDDPSLGTEFLGFNFSDDWPQFGQLDFPC